MDLDCFSGAGGNRAFHFHWRRTGDASLELAAAVVVRMAANYLLAGGGIAGAVPDSVRRRRWARVSSIELPAADGGALGADDAGGAGEVARENAGTLRRVWRGKHRNEVARRVGWEMSARVS